MRGAIEPTPFGAISSGREVRAGSSRVRDPTVYLLRFCELDRGGRTVGKRLGVRPPSTSGYGFSVALEQRVGARIGAECDGSASDRERCTTAALLETRKAG
jgi:hypothetical protein